MKIIEVAEEIAREMLTQGWLEFSARTGTSASQYWPTEEDSAYIEEELGSLDDEFEVACWVRRILRAAEEDLPCEVLA